jgi:hypothetical protein
MMKKPIWVVTLATLVSTASCGDDSNDHGAVNPGADADTDAGADAKTDADTDAGADAETDTDTDASADAETDTDTDASADAETDADTDASADAEVDADTDASADAEVDAGLDPVLWRFDFNTATSETADGFVGVGSSNAYDAINGYGWESTAQTFTRPTVSSPLLADGHWGSSSKTFLVDVANGDFHVNVTLGDGSFARDQISIGAEGESKLSGLATAAGQFLHRSFPVTVADSQLSIQVASNGGDPYFTINALEVLRKQDVHSLVTTDGGLTFAGSGASPGALITVGSSLGTITNTDADPWYAGVQITAGANGTFGFGVEPPLGGGVVTITTEEVTGRASGNLQHDYAPPGVRRFDFNGSSVDTQSGFTGVRGSQLYEESRGFGWTQAVTEAERATVSKTSVALYRDFHWGSAQRTFQVKVLEGATYYLRAYVGDSSFARNNIQISIDGGVWLNVANTAANAFTTLVTMVASTDGDGLLQITIRNNGGDPYWVINGLDVWVDGQADPGEAP